MKKPSLKLKKFEDIIILFGENIISHHDTNRKELMELEKEFKDEKTSFERRGVLADRFKDLHERKIPSFPYSKEEIKEAAAYLLEHKKDLPKQTKYSLENIDSTIKWEL